MAKCRYLKFLENNPKGWDISKVGSGLLQAKQLGDESLLLVFSPFKWKRMVHLVKQLHEVQKYRPKIQIPMRFPVNQSSCDRSRLHKLFIPQSRKPTWMSKNLQPGNNNA